MPFPHTVLDANVLAQAYVRDLLLDADALGLFHVRWTDAILHDTRRVYIHELGRDPAAIDALLTAMRREFPHATITGYEKLITAMTVDPKDRHVAAAATWAQADFVTFNLRHFLPRDLAPFGVQAVRPDLFLATLAEDHQEALTQIVRVQAGRRTNPPLSPDAFLVRLARPLPRFSAIIGAALHEEG